MRAQNLRKSLQFPPRREAGSQGDKEFKEFFLRKAMKASLRAERKTIALSPCASKLPSLFGEGSGVRPVSLPSGRSGGGSGRGLCEVCVKSV